MLIFAICIIVVHELFKSSTLNNLVSQEFACSLPTLYENIASSNFKLVAYLAAIFCNF